MNQISIKKIASATGLFLGAFALSVMAADWTPAPCEAPGCNTPAPINVGGAWQSKEGDLTLEKTLSVGKETAASGYSLDVNGLGFFSGVTVSGLADVANLKVTSPGFDTAGKVLTSNGEGIAEWKTPAAGQGQAQVPVFIALPANGDYNLGAHTLCVFSGDHVGNNTVVGNQANSLRRNNDGTWVANVSSNGAYLNSKYSVGVYCI